MSRIALYLLLFALIKTSIFGQSIELNGLVIDSITSQPVAYASVGIKNLGIGTITNEQGNFILRLPNSAINQEVTVQIMGYKPYPFLFTSKNINIRLVPSPIKLREVIVLPRDTLLEMLRLAYKSIPQNYPTKPVRYTGFYRETQKSDDSLYLNFSEAILEVYKNSYKNNSNFGQIRIIKSRKNNFPGLDTINNVRFYGGPHLSHSRDFVFKRSDFINPKHFRKYNYWLTNQIKNGNDITYCIEFEHKNGRTTGTLYIEKKSLAFIGLDLYRKREESTFLRSYKHLDTFEKVGYQKFDEKWHLSYIIYKTNGFNSEFQKKIYLHDEYVTTSIHTDSVKPIPFNQEFGYIDVISIEANDYSNSDWTDYNILEKDSILSAQNTLSVKESMNILAKTTQPQEKSNREFIYNILKKISYDFGLAYIPINNEGGLYQTTYQDNTRNELKSEKTVSSGNYALPFYWKVAYTFDKHWGVFYNSNSSISTKLSISSNDIGIQYVSPLFKNYRKWLFDVGLAYSSSQYFISLGNAEKNNDEMFINNKKFDANKVEELVGLSLSGIKPSISINYQIGKFSYLFLKVSSSINTSTSTIANFKEKSGFYLLRKNQSIKTTNTNYQLSIDNIPTTKPNITVQPYQLTLGLSYRL